MAAPTLAGQGATGVLVSRLRVTEDTANPQHCSLERPQKLLLLAQRQWLAAEQVEPRVPALPKARATLLNRLLQFCTATRSHFASSWSASAVP